MYTILHNVINANHHVSSYMKPKNSVQYLNSLEESLFIPFIMTNLLLDLLLFKFLVK